MVMCQRIACVVVVTAAVTTVTDSAEVIGTGRSITILQVCCYGIGFSCRC